MANTTHKQGTGYTPVSPQMTIPFEVYIDEDVLLRLNEYARAALPTEIGGLARIQSVGDRDVMVTDIRMLEQNATGGTFSIDAEMVTDFIAELIDEDRADEVEEWCSIVHTHPVGMGPSMSGVDVDNIIALADDGHFFSLILGASREGDSNRIAMHYAQATSYGDTLLLKSLKVQVVPADKTQEVLAAEEAYEAARVELERTRSIHRDQTRAEIEAEVPTIVKDTSPSYTRRAGNAIGRALSVTPSPNVYQREQERARQERVLREQYNRVWSRDEDDGLTNSWDWWARNDEAGRKSLLEMTDKEFVEHMMDEHGVDKADAELMLAGAYDKELKA